VPLDKVCLTVTDNGRFELDQNLTGLDLRHARKGRCLERPFDLETQPGVGLILIELPLLELNLQEKPEQTGSIIPPEAKADFQPCTVLYGTVLSQKRFLSNLSDRLPHVVARSLGLVLSPVVENLALHLAERATELSLRRRQYFCCKNLPFNLKY